MNGSIGSRYAHRRDRLLLRAQQTLIEFRGDRRAPHRPPVPLKTVGHRPTEAFEDVLEYLANQRS